MLEIEIWIKVFQRDPDSHVQVVTLKRFYDNVSSFLDSIFKVKQTELFQKRTLNLEFQIHLQPE